MSSRASSMLTQTRVPTSTTEVCISALTRSSRRNLPWASISVSMCERRSRVTGSMVWYSSSMPREKDGRMESPGDNWGDSLGAIVKQGSGSGSGGQENGSAQAYNRGVSNGIYQDRRDAGRVLAHAIGEAHLPDLNDAIVLGLVRGGMPVAFEIAMAFGLPLDVMIVRK